MGMIVESGKFNIYNWIFQRISGILLLLLVGLHLLRMHGYNQDTWIYRVLLQYINNSTWKIIDISFLVLVVYHGMYGIYSLARDYINKSVFVRVISVLLIIIGLITLVRGYRIVF